MDDITGETLPDESEQLDQLQPGDSLIDRGVDDVLDEGYIAPDQWSPAQGFGNTPAEMRQGETLEMRMKQETPEKVEDPQDWNPSKESRQVGAVRAGRLMAVQGADGEQHTLGIDVGYGGGAASAEEAAMHVISDDEDDDFLED
ncbi:DUF5709 domain-containing protein [Tessaracoccus flavus]|uniref:Uncharacterized protein n=1 Tax=Tessaracoccus flavus TaxID=1610493 RepID=A0A1Q2CDR2_9ACTN|nr:DUF5709 domain-containing protein [Tessaracoccus flavus]AQP44248.1 hypothetical protein RPIT_04990 [Tessaracoccus flavus]SDY39496.1 hypothetical protein SAMN05428934_101604 [Tessaracoccus flavus]